MRPKDLDYKIELLRAQMISVGLSNGLTAPETIQLSQKLDILLNIQQQEKARPLKMTEPLKSYLTKIITSIPN